MMFAPMKRLAALSLAVVGVCVVGCDEAAEANKNVLDKMATANAKIAKLPSLQPITYKEGTRAETDLQAVRTELSSAVGEKGASPVLTALAASSLGSVDLNAAIYARAELVNVEQKIRRELALMRQSVQQIALTNTLATGYRAANPSAAIANTTTQVASMQGNANLGLWGPGADPQIVPNLQSEKTLPTLAAVKQEISRLDGEITKKQQEVKDLTTQQNEAFAASETALQKADTQRGDEAVKTYTEAAQAKRKGEDLKTQIDLVNDAIGRLQADLAVQKTQESTLGVAIAGLQEQAKRLSAGWDEQQKRADAQTAIAKDILDGDKDLTIAKRGKTIATLVADAKTRREDLMALLDEAEKYFDNASKDAGTFSTSLTELTNSQSANAASYKGLRDIIHAQRHKLQKGVVQRELGAIKASEAAVAADFENTKKLLQEAVTPASLQSPSEFDGIDIGSAKDLISDADTRLSTAVTTLTEVETGDSGDPKKGVQNSAKVARLIALVGRIQLAELKAAPPVNEAAAGDLEAIRTDALSVKKEIIDSGLKLPPLPGEWGETPPPTAPAPAAPEGSTTPADGTTPPAEGGTTPAPATPPAEGGAMPAPEEGAAPAAPAEGGAAAQ